MPGRGSIRVAEKPELLEKTAAGALAECGIAGGAVSLVFALRDRRDLRDVGDLGQVGPAAGPVQDGRESSDEARVPGRQPSGRERNGRAVLASLRQSRSRRRLP